MVERKLFKTKLCVLYQRGNCLRQSCSFAHGDAELRRFSGSGSASFNGRRDYRVSDLRDKLERKHSPQRRYSPGRDARGRHALHGQKLLPHDRGYSPSRSPVRSERRHRKKQHLDGQSDVSGSLKISDSTDGIKERKAMSSSAKDALEEQLKEVHLDIDMLDNHKGQLEVDLENKVQEADNLISRNEELQIQLSKEQEDCKRTTSIIKKFIKVHNRYSKAQEELKRSQARLQRLGDQLAFDALRPNTNAEDSSVNVVSDEEPNGENGMSPRNALKNHTSPSKKRPQVSHGVSEEVKAENLRKCLVGAAVSEKLTQVDETGTQSNKNGKEADGPNKNLFRGIGHRPVANEENNNKRRKNGSFSISPVEKVKGLESGHVLPPTCMAAHAVDELIEVVEMEKMVDAATTVFEKSTLKEKTSLPYLPPPPPLPSAAPKSAFKQYEDEDVDVDELDMESHDVDMNYEVDIEQL